MGLRSRQRRRDGVAHAEMYDVDTSRHHSRHSLEDHLRASIRDADTFNLTWKKTVAIGGFVVLGYELLLLYQLIAGGVSTNNIMSASRWPISVILKIVAIASVVSMREYISTGSTKFYGRSLFFTGSYFMLWICCVALLHDSLTVMEVSPLCLVYFGMSLLMLRLIGDNTKAEVARAQQLKRLEQLYSQNKY
uniref:Uncharacterized protein n=1 Tax=Globisporangium ultimum (strain ATCC 200006 / CBS 805.95 / DAOM BR144) TaxID=431595 RepID=K3WWQ0_GLOUD